MKVVEFGVCHRIYLYLEWHLSSLFALRNVLLPTQKLITGKIAVNY